jgi:hypothetical protein
MVRALTAARRFTPGGFFSNFDIIFTEANLATGRCLN